MFVHNRWQPCACVHMCSACRLASPKYIYSPHALNRSATDKGFYSKCVALCITRNDEVTSSCCHLLLIQVSQKVLSVIKGVMFFSWFHLLFNQNVFFFPQHLRICLLHFLRHIGRDHFGIMTITCMTCRMCMWDMFSQPLLDISGLFLSVWAQKQMFRLHPPAPYATLTQALSI